MVLSLSKFESRMIQSGKDVYVFIAYFTSTFFHELSHYLISLLLGGKPIDFKIIPKKQVFKKDGNIHTYWELGYVTTTNFNWFNAFPISFAPLLLVPIAFFLYVNFFLSIEQTLLNTLIMYFILYSLISSSLPSMTDVRLGLSKIASPVVHITIGYFFYQNYNHIQGVYYETKSFIFSSFY